MYKGWCRKKLWCFCVIQLHIPRLVLFGITFSFLFFSIMSGFSELIRDQADVSLGSIQPSLSSSLSESSDSDSSIATRLAKMEATSNGAALRSNSFCSDFSTLRRVMPTKIKLELTVDLGKVEGTHHLEWPSSNRCVGHGMEALSSWPQQCAVAHHFAGLALAFRRWPGIWAEFGVASTCAGCHCPGPCHPLPVAVVVAAVAPHSVATSWVSARIGEIKYQ